MNETPDPVATPSRRRGRPPKIILQPTSILAPPQESAAFTRVESVQPDPSPPVPTVPFPFSDEIDLREKPELRSPIIDVILPGSDSKVRGASEVIPLLDAGVVLHSHNPALPGSVLPPPPPVVPPVTVSGWEPVQGGDVVQVSNPQNKLYGTLFTVGDVRNHKVHGYQIGAGGKHEYFTASEDECFRIGPSKVRSRNGCSSKWNAEKR